MRDMMTRDMIEIAGPVVNVARQGSVIIYATIQLPVSEVERLLSAARAEEKIRALEQENEELRAKLSAAPEKLEKGYTLERADWRKLRYLYAYHEENLSALASYLSTSVENLSAALDGKALALTVCNTLLRRLRSRYAVLAGTESEPPEGYFRDEKEPEAPALAQKKPGRPKGSKGQRKRVSQKNPNGTKNPKKVAAGKAGARARWAKEKGKVAHA
jgi:hypothetical protein